MVSFLLCCTYSVQHNIIKVLRVIKSFKCKETEKIWNGIKSKSFPGDIQGRALRKLRQIDASKVLDDLKSPPGNRLELLKGDRTG